MDDFKGFKTPVKEETEYVAKLFQSHDKILMEEHEQREWFIEIKSSPGEGAVKITDTITKYLEYYINLVDKAASGFKIEFNFERRSTVSKMLPNSTDATEKSLVKCRVNQCLILRIRHSHSTFQEPPL